MAKWANGENGENCEKAAVLRAAVNMPRRFLCPIDMSRYLCALRFIAPAIE